MTTTRDGLVIPKQYCSIGRPTCLLQDALRRAEAVAMPAHVCAVVATQHKRWWTSAVGQLNDSNVIVQPQDKGTAFGILLALLQLEAINPAASVTLLPADHYYRDESTITRMLRMTANLAAANPSSIFLLGSEPDGPDPEFGYILPAQKVRDKPTNIAGFTEKPAPDYAEELISLGALWNLFILVGTVGALLDLFEEDYALYVIGMRAALKRRTSGELHALEAYYENLSPIDFSRDVLEVQASRLQVVRVPSCGWTDLGTPRRVEATLRNLSQIGTLPGGDTRAPTPLFFDIGRSRDAGSCVQRAALER